MNSGRNMNRQGNRHNDLYDNDWNSRAFSGIVFAPPSFVIDDWSGVEFCPASVL
jgi:hypothetical protein